MIYVVLEGHDYKYEVYELIKLFYCHDDIEFIKDRALVDNQSLLIENHLISNTVYTKIFLDSKCISSYEVNNINDLGEEYWKFDKKAKLAIKQSLYESINKIAHVKAPWGILTGVRPTKIAHEIINNNPSIDIKDIIINRYKMTENKAELIIEIAKRQRKFIFPTDKNKFSLYVSIPFCPTRCIYCSFPSNPLNKFEDLVSNYVDNLIKEIKCLGDIMKDKVIETVYIGGGTPTSIPTNYLDAIIKQIYKSFGAKFKELTVEAGRPDTINKDMLVMLKENKVGRISINPQTMNEKTLKLIGRSHTPDDIINAYYLAREIGFDVINMDIIVGLPGENTKDIRLTMDEIAKLQPDNLTVHTMALKKSSKIRENLHDYILSNQKIVEDMLSITREYAKTMNMHPYYMYRQKQILGNFENVGYSKKGKECVYNILIMEEKQSIVAVGAGGVSKIYFPEEDRIERVPNVKNIYEYINRLDEMVDKKKRYLISVDTN